jgi:hypothetical protein
MRSAPGSGSVFGGGGSSADNEVSLMNSQPQVMGDQARAASYELRFDSAYKPGRGVSIPCDDAGRVDLDALSERLRTAYLGARAMVGREYLYPTVRPRH